MSEDQKAKYDRARAATVATRWDEVEAESGCRVSPVLLALYADHRLVTLLELLVQEPGKTPPDGEWSLAQFEDPTPASLRPHGQGDDLRVAFGFASSYSSYLYGVLLDADGHDGPVYRYSFDGDELKVADSLAQFLSWIRKRRPSGYLPPAG